MDDRVRRGLVALAPYALAVVIAFGMVASALSVPLAHVGRSPHAAAWEPGVAAPSALDVETATGGDRVRSRTGHPHAAHAAPVGGGGDPRTSEPHRGEPHRGDAPVDDHFECCIMRLGVVGSPAPALAAAHLLTGGGRRGRAPRPRTPTRPRPWRASLGRHPPVAAAGSMLAN